MTSPRVVLLVAAALGALTCNEPDRTMRVGPDDAVRCCFFVPYEGIAGSVPDEQCMPHPVCPRPGQDDAEDVCMPLACRSGDTSPCGRPGPKGTVDIHGSCTFDAGNTRIERGGCSGVGEASTPRI